MDFAYGPEEEAFRTVVRAWLAEHLVGEYAALGPDAVFHASDWKVRVAWEQELGRDGWVGLTWPRAFGGREVPVLQELVFAEEYVRADGPVRAGFFGEGLLGPTLIAFGTDEQRARFLPPILRGEEYWCQGFSEPGAGSDLAGVSTKATLDGGSWRLDGQKLWTSQAQYADWIFVLCRTEPDQPKHKGLSFLLVPMDQPGVEVRPLVDMTGSDHFCEVFFDGAVTAADMIVSGRGDGWKVAMGTLGFERGTAFLAQQARFAKQFDALLGVARERGATSDPLIRQRLAQAYAGLQLIRYSGVRTITAVLRDGRPGPEASVGKVLWSEWHQRLGVLAMDILGADAMLANEFDHLFLFSRSETIYAGSSQVQRTIAGERVLGLPKEPESR